MKATLQPYHNNLILEPIEASPMIGTIIIPEKHIQQLNQGKVLDKGPLVSDKIKLGDIVFFAGHTESRINWRGNKFIVVPESDCLGCITQQEETFASKELINSLK